MSFFLRKSNKNPPKGLNNKKKFDSKTSHSEPKVTKKRKIISEEISSDSEDDTIRKKKNNVEDLSDNDTETAQEKKIRLAKRYLQQIESEEKVRLECEDIDSQVIKGRLRDDVLEQSGRLQRKIADNYVNADIKLIKTLKNGHKLSVTCVVVSSKYIFSASKDCSIIKWDLENGKKLTVISGGKKSDAKHIGHTSCILALAVSSDSKFLVSGCYNKIINVWNPETMQLIHTFKGHRGPISGLSFRKGSHQLFSCSFDRSVKVWNCDEMSYVETLFGHHDSITAIDSLIRERAITSGGRDASVRIWKIIEESQLVFQGNNTSIDCVKLINEQHFVSASDDGSISLWGVLKKKPLVSYPNAHGMGTSVSNWITSLAVLRNTDLIASGSSDGMIRLWKCAEDFKKIEPLFSIPILGFVNSMEFTSNGDFLVAAVGQEHRLGRWWRVKEAKNSIAIIPLNHK